MKYSTISELFSVLSGTLSLSFWVACVSNCHPLVRLSESCHETLQRSTQPPTLSGMGNEDIAYVVVACVLNIA